MSRDLQQVLVDELGLLLDPLVGSTTAAGRRQLFAAAGWDLDAISGVPISSIEAVIADFTAAYGQLAALAARPPRTLDDLQGALAAADRTVSGVKALGSIAAAPGLRRPPDFERIGADVVELLTLSYLHAHHPVVFRLAALLALIEPDDQVDATVAPDPLTGRPARLHVPRPRLRLDRLPDLVRDPAAYLRGAYLDGGLVTEADAQRVSDRLLPRVGALLDVLGARTAYGTRPEDGVDFGAAGNPLAARMLSVEYELGLDGALEGSAIGAALALTSAEREGAGLVVVPTARLELAQELLAWALELKVSAAVAAVALRAGGVTIAGPADVGAVDASLTATKLAENGAALVLGPPAGTRLEIGELVVRARAGLAPERLDLLLAADARSGAFVVAAADGDGFLARVLPPEGLRMEFELGLGWSTAKGLHFSGAAGLDATLPVKSRLGPVRVDAVHLGLEAGDDGVTALAAATATVTLGPVTIVVERVGLEAELGTDGGNLGAADLALRFKPPDGAALKVDAGVAKGGGYLFFDRDREQYAGVVKLELGGRIALTAVGLLTTRMPDGSRGFSLLLIITAEGFAPVQLGFGFTLTGVGGIIGVNRTANAAALRAGLKTGALDSVLFPADPVRNAPAIVSAINSLMPPAPGRFLLGPMALISWGTPTVLTIKLALLLELPQPVRLALLGRVSVLLPDARKPIVRLQMDAFGLLDVDRGELSLDATLSDSRLQQFVLSGDMALRMNWGADPTFVLAVGGRNPRFAVPEGFPALERVSLSLAQRSDLTLRLSAYLALTSNSAQLGARVDLAASAGGFQVEGTLGFDAFLQLHPFGFVADLAANLALRHDGTLLFSVNLQMTLSGPAPWHARGRAGFQLLGVSCELTFDHRFGAAEPLPPPAPVDVVALLLAELADARNWSSELPAGESPAVTLRAAPDGAPAVHPLGTVALRQRRVPLGRRLARFGAAAPSQGPVVLGLEVAATDGRPLQLERLEDLFALGEFEALTDDQRLAASAFVPMESGFRLGSGQSDRQDGLRIDSDAGRETVVLDPMPA